MVLRGISIDLVGGGGSDISPILSFFLKKTYVMDFFFAVEDSWNFNLGHCFRQSS